MSLDLPVHSHALRAVKLPSDCWLSWPEVKQLVAAFNAESVPLRFVGGAVRDALLGRRVKDIDAATPLPPQKVMSLLEKAEIKAIPTGLSHGTITAIINKHHFEITTLRKDVKTYGRHADVLFTDQWEEDAKRRDFTMNALYCDPDGVVHDYTDGVQDAKGGVVRFIGDAGKRVQEDGLRILRFFRFTAHYGHGELDKAGLQACKQHWALLENLSGERIQQEMLKLIASDRAPEMLDVMERAALTESLFPGEIDTEILHLWPKVRLMADAKPNPLLALALLLRAQPESGQLIQKLNARWKLSNQQVDTLEKLTSLQAVEVDLDEAGQKKLLRALGEEFYTMLILISWTERMQHDSSNTQLLAAAYRAMLALTDLWEPPIFPLTGEELIELGMSPSPELGEWLKQLETHWEAEGYQPSKADLIHYFENHR